MSAKLEEVSPALKAAQTAQAEITVCLKERKTFRLEAGAGAGKTYSLIEALKWLIDNQGKELLRANQKIACMTYTNVAVEEILSRIDRHPAVIVTTIHSFCWSAMKSFQPFLRAAIPTLSGWPERLAEAEKQIGILPVEYELGYPSINDERVSLSHDDIVALIPKFLAEPKFRQVFVSKFPVLFIDEYQDTNKAFAEAIQGHFLGKEGSPQIGFFGDHWQKIYPTGCGKIEHAAIHPIDKGANFRSAPPVVNLLNKLRPELPQAVKDPDEKGEVLAYHTNEWSGERRKDNHWQDDLPADVAHQFLQSLTKQLAAEGWNFADPKATKILMLTNGLLAQEQEYPSFHRIFKYSESYLNKENPAIKFLAEIVEPVREAFSAKKYGDMFKALGRRAPAISSHAEKKRWSDDMTGLVSAAERGSIGDVLAHLQKSRKPQLPESVLRQFDKLREFQEAQKIGGAASAEEKPRSLAEFENLLPIAYRELSALNGYINDRTPFATKHGVKGQEFEHVLVVFGRGWNHYNFNQMIEWYAGKVPADKTPTFERNRNLFYVSCSRSKRKLVLFFTQKLSATASAQLEEWIGKGNVISLGANPS